MAAITQSAVSLFSGRRPYLAEPSEDDNDEETPMLESTGTRGSSSSPEREQTELKLFPEAAVLEPDLLKRTLGKTFESESLVSFYKPLESYEGYHRYDPDFEWTAKEEQRVVRRVCVLHSLTVLQVG